MSNEDKKKDAKQFILDKNNNLQYKSDLYKDPADINNAFCVECKNPVIICCGDKRPSYIRHSTGKKGGCTFYELQKAGDINIESMSNRITAIHILVDLLKNKNLSTLQKCHYCECTKTRIFEDKDYDVRPNYIYTKSDGGKTKADVALLYDKEVVIVFEIFGGTSIDFEYKKTTDKEWFKLSSEDIIPLYKETTDHQFLSCYRKFKCDECEKKHKEEFKTSQRVRQEMEREKINDNKMILTLDYTLHTTDLDNNDSEEDYIKMKGVIFWKQLDMCILLSIDNKTYFNTNVDIIEHINKQIELEDGGCRRLQLKDKRVTRAYRFTKELEIWK